ncbi:MAG: reverse transcriptase/maturase family protein [Candidatus Paceibacterota bacterium]|jgi:retron-type reverse transcriptase
MSNIQFIHIYQDIISVENLLLAWKEFLVGKKFKKDVLDFERDLMSNILELHKELSEKNYRHSDYYAFNISDPKPRNIHKAKVRDRLLHHALYRQLYPFFNKTFIADSYSCRLGKGTHRAIKRFREFSNKVSKNNTKTVWILKCDIRKFFASVDHNVLKSILKKYITDENILCLLDKVIDSFNTKEKQNVGLPLGNLTSQLLVNIYMNEFDQFVKHKLKAKYYIRYSDDFVILQNDKVILEDLLLQISFFLEERLKLSIHPDKVFIKTLSSGLDYLGWVNFQKHRVIRTATKKKIIKKLKGSPKSQTISSYRGLLGHGNSYELKKRLGLVKLF